MDVETELVRLNKGVTAMEDDAPLQENDTIVMMDHEANGNREKSLGKPRSRWSGCMMLPAFCASLLLLLALAKLLLVVLSQDNSSNMMSSSSFSSFNAASLGSPDAPMALVMYNDFLCPCSKWACECFQENLIDKGHVEQGCVSFALRDAAAKVLDHVSCQAAVATRCAGHQGLHWDMALKLFDNQFELKLFASNETVNDMLQDWFSSLNATSSSVMPADPVSFADCLEDAKQALENEIMLASCDAIYKPGGTNGTPSHALNEKIVGGEREKDQILNDAILWCS